MFGSCSQIGDSDDFSFPFGVDDFSLDEVGNIACLDYPLDIRWQNLKHVIVSLFFFFLNEGTADVRVAQLGCSDRLTSVEHVIVVSLVLRWEFFCIFQSNSL